MFNLTIRLENKPGALADMGETLGTAGVSVEGGGCWQFNGEAIAHFCSRTVKPQDAHSKQKA